MATIKIGLIGCGKQAAKHISGFGLCPEVEIVLADKDPALACALAEKERLAWVEDPVDVFSDPAIAAVDLCVPTPYHAPLIRQALAAGKDFFCEKPLCESLVDASEIDELTRRSGRIGMVGYVYRYAPVFQKARAILDGAAETGASPVLGKITVATMRIGGRGSAALWKHRASEGGGVVGEMLVHMLDLAIWCFGPIETAEVLMHELLQPQRAIAGRTELVDAEDFLVARFRTRSGVPFVIQADLVTPAFTQLLEVQGQNGTLMASIQPEMPQFVYAARPAGGYAAGYTPLGAGPANLFESQMAAFVTAVRSRNPQANGTLAASVEAMRAIDMLQSIKAGRTGLRVRI
ncbi:MAG TPA: Gfo/Idh/MocA family oxidoreductase [Stellaceae bacterium]